MRNKRKALQKLQRRTKAEQAEQAEEEEEEEEEEDVEEPYDDAPPPTWPRPGHGLYAKLPPEDEDRSYLDDDNVDVAFAHFGREELQSMRTVSVKA